MTGEQHACWPAAGRTVLHRAALCLAVALGPVAAGLAGCQQGSAPTTSPVTSTLTGQVPAPGSAMGSVLAVAPPAPALRSGTWLGGPDHQPGKPRSGITSWWTPVPATARAGTPFTLQLVLDDVVDGDATVSVSASDGARLVGAPVQAWALRASQPAQLRLQVVAPAGQSFVNVQTHQGNRTSVRAILVTLPADPADPVAPGPTAGSASRPSNAVVIDASGEPIVRQQP